MSKCKNPGTTRLCMKTRNAKKNEKKTWLKQKMGGKKTNR
jgi:hypothetical protein